MKFSVLLPTRNRLEYLRLAVATVMRQDDDDWEVIVSDNDSEDDIAGFVESLRDPRVKYFRTERFVPVTENWNNALARSSGSYVIMLGDDDGLMRGYLSTMRRLIEEYSQPDAIYTAAFIFAYPGVMKDHPSGYLHLHRNSHFPSKEPLWLNRDLAGKLVGKSMKFRMDYALNMQHSLISRTFIDSLSSRGPFFQSPYPDFYATNVLFLKAKRVLIYQRPLVTIGITKKSYGFFHFNNDEEGGMDFLRNAADPETLARLDGVIIPSSRNNTSWLLALEQIRNNYGHEFPLRISYRRYRTMQILNAYKNFYLDKRLSPDAFRRIVRKMRMSERVLLGLPISIFLRISRLVPGSSRERLIGLARRLMGQYAALGPDNAHRPYQSILDVFQDIDPLHA